MHRLSILLAFGIFSTALCLAAQEAVVLPAPGAMDDRPFFATRRHPAIDYYRQPTDPVGELARKVVNGSARLVYEETTGYLRSVLEALNVPVESQSVVFSKTSLQSHWITPSNPRALYYSDEVAVGFIRSAPLLEIAALDPRQGVVFYAIEQKPVALPVIARSDSCLSCHESRNTMDVPGLLIRSMGVGTGGQTMPQIANFISDHRSPFEERWGGWLISGKTGTAHHLGNLTHAGDGQSYDSEKVSPATAAKIEMPGYLSPNSDVAAVLVLNHQVRMTNLLTRVGWEGRVALDRMGQEPRDNAAAQKLIAADVRELVDYMLFVDETPLPGKFEQATAFPAKFAAAGPQDKQGRSLRQLDLGKRLMRYPCSYMIYSRSFEALPGAVKEAIYSRLWTILSGQDKASKYSKLTRTDRAAIVGILLETKPGLPAYFKPL